MARADIRPPPPSNTHSHLTTHKGRGGGEEEREGVRENMWRTICDYDCVCVWVGLCVKKIQRESYQSKDKVWKPGSDAGKKGEYKQGERGGKSSSCEKLFGLSNGLLQPNWPLKPCTPLLLSLLLPSFPFLHSKYILQLLLQIWLQNKVSLIWNGGGQKQDSHFQLGTVDFVRLK